MAYIPLQLIALNDSESSPGNFVVVLEGPAPLRKRLPIIIGLHEAQAIALHIEKIATSRPLTHDLFVLTLQTLQCNLKAVVIDQLVDDVFHSQLHIEQGNQAWSIDARTSDAIALAVRFDAPIQIRAALFEEMAMLDPAHATQIRGSLWEYSLAELDLMLHDLLQKEDYERAAKVRDIIAQKKQREQH